MDARTQDILERLTVALEKEAEDDTPAPTVCEATEAYLLQLEALGRADSTMKSYRQRLGLFVDDFGSSAVDAVTRRMVHEWIADMRRQSKRWEEHPKRPAESGSLSPATIAGRVQALKAFFRWCMDEGFLEESPAAPLRQPPYEPRETKAMEAADLRAMIGVARRRARRGQPRDLAILLFLADTGCRVGEIVSLRLAGVDLAAFEAEVDGKTGLGLVDFTETTAEALAAWLKIRPQLDHDYVFTSLGSNYGQPIGAGTVYQLLKRMAKKADVDGRYNPHSIRHLVGQRFTDRGNLELARKKLRHSSIETTARYYANQDRARLKKATDDLSLTRDGENAKGKDQ